MAVMVVGVPWGDFLGKEKRILRLEELWEGAENFLVPFIGPWEQGRRGTRERPLGGDSGGPSLFRLLKRRRQGGR
jgi:hypothetical protein